MLLYFSELNKAKTDMTAMKKQSESLATEYDRLSSEHASLQVFQITKHLECFYFEWYIVKPWFSSFVQSHNF